MQLKSILPCVVLIFLSSCSLHGTAVEYKKGVSMTGKWTSEVAGGEVGYEVIEPSGAKDKPLAVVVYLKGLAVQRVGQEGDESIIASFTAMGELAVIIDYAKHPRAKVPYLNRDIYKLRSDIHGKKLLGEYRVDMAHVFVVAEGCRLMRDVKYYRDGERVLGMDIIYPSKPDKPVGAILEFSCDNKDRMGMYSLVFCSDTILEAGASAGFAVAMADHPVAPPYKGLDPMPDSAYKLKAAVRTLRWSCAKLGTNGRIGVVGFSRGSGMALLLAATNTFARFDGKGENVVASSDVQAAVIMSGRFDYLDLLPTDAMIPRYEKAWGLRKDNEEVWRRHGAMSYVTKDVAPLLLTINRMEGPDALHQMETLRKRLDELDVKYQWMPEEEARGHKVPLDEKILEGMYGFFREHLK
jgi:acetyl esterase/lipase